VPKFYKILEATSNLVSEGGNKSKYHTEDPQTFEATITAYSHSGQQAPDSFTTFNSRIYLVSH